jgi:hypothetical protein
MRKTVYLKVLEKAARANPVGFVRIHTIRTKPMGFLEIQNEENGFT